MSIRLRNQKVTPVVKVVNAETLNVTPTTSTQTIAPTSGKNCFNEVNVAAVTSAIDSNITAGNIKKNVTILGVTGTYGNGDFVSIPMEVSVDGVYKAPSAYTLPSNITSIGAYAFYHMFFYSDDITSADFSSLTVVDGNNAMYYAFEDCGSLSSVDFSNLISIKGNSAFMRTFDAQYGRLNMLTSVSFPKLTSIDGNDVMSHTFRANRQLANVNMSKLESINGERAFNGTFRGCAALTSIEFTSLHTITGQSCFRNTFSECSKLSSISFPALTSTFNVPVSGTTYKNQFYNMLEYAARNVTVHFPSNLQSVIGSWSDVTNGFGGTNTTVLYDLPATT